MIEVGDYVNGAYVTDVYLEGTRHYIKLRELEHIRIYGSYVEEIVTHEQFEAMEYKVEE